MSPTQGPVLFVDDDPDLGLVIQVGLRNYGYDVHIEERMKAAQEWLLKTPGVSMIISDVMMPDGSGYDFFRWIRRQEFLSEVPVIVCTGLKDDESLNDFLDAGAVDCLHKPFDLKNLVEKMERVWARSSRKAGQG